MEPSEPKAARAGRVERPVSWSAGHSASRAPTQTAGRPPLRPADSGSDPRAWRTVRPGAQREARLAGRLSPSLSQMTKPPGRQSNKRQTSGPLLSTASELSAGALQVPHSDFRVEFNVTSRLRAVEVSPRPPAAGRLPPPRATDPARRAASDRLAHFTRPCRLTVFRQLAWPLGQTNQIGLIVRLALVRQGEPSRRPR